MLRSRAALRKKGKLLLRGGFQQRNQRLEFGCAGITDDAVAEGALAPRFDMERRRQARAVEAVKGELLLRDKDRDEVSATLVDEQGGVFALEEDQAAAKKREIGSGELGQVEGKGNFALEPGFDRMPVGGDHIDRRG